MENVVASVFEFESGEFEGALDGQKIMAASTSYTGKTLKASFAFCSPKDTFNKNVGVLCAEGRLRGNKCVMLLKDRPEFPKETIRRFLQGLSQRKFRKIKRFPRRGGKSRAVSYVVPDGETVLEVYGDIKVPKWFTANRVEQSTEVVSNIKIKNMSDAKSHECSCEKC
jgi:hypothetical protein